MTPTARGATILDQALELSVVGSFSRIGCGLRRRAARWEPYERLDGRRAVVTGATSGIGAAIATALARLGAAVDLLVRDVERGERARRSIAEAAGVDAATMTVDVADLADLGSVREYAARFRARSGSLDVLVHDAGLLTHRFQRAVDGAELTATVHVLGPFALTAALLEPLAAARAPRVVTVSSGGMYTQRLDVAGLDPRPAEYDGVRAYARAKRAQVVVNHEWARRHRGTGIAFHAMHPGWVDTPGIVAALPTFRRVLRPLLRDAAMGADTAVWLASTSSLPAPGGRFWHDRRPRLEHRVPWTRHDPAEADRLWSWCEQRTAGR